jgi:flagellar protein FlaI
MIVCGVIGSFPFLLAMTKVLLISINVGVREDYKQNEEELGLMDAVKGVGEVEGKTATQDMMMGGEEDDQEGGLPKSVDDVQEETTPDVLQDVESKLTTYEEPDDFLETHDDFRLEEYGTYVEIERYWLKEPYSYAVILYNEEDDDYRYFAIEPQLNDAEKELYREFQDRLETALRSDSVDDEFEEEMVDAQKMEILEDRVFEIATEYNISISDLSLQKIMYYIERDYVGYKQIDVLMNDINAEDISCVGPNQPLWINHSEYENIATNIQFERRPLQRFISQLAQRSGEQISAADPMQDATLPDGSRAQLTLGDDITTEGSTFTIRQFQDIPFTPVDLIRTHTFNLAQMAFLWLAIQNNQSLIFAGGTASGKTTSMNAMSLFIPPKAKVVTLEDTREITLPHENWIPGKTREGTSQEEDASDEISMYNLLEAALRQRPEYLVVGEVRGEEAQTLFQAMSTGHTTYSTMHADTVREAIHRLENDPINVPEKMVNNLDIICIQRRMMQDGSAIRRNINVTEIEEAGSGSGHSVNQVFERDPETDDWIDNTNDSSVLEFIKKENVWTQEDLRDEMERRKKVLQYLIDQDVYRFRGVTRVIQKYMNEDDKDNFMEKIENETLDPEEIDDITNVDLDNVETRMHEDKTEQIMS